MPDLSQGAQNREGHSVPLGIPLAALIAVLFLFASTFFPSGQKSFDVAAQRLNTEFPSHH
jgi:mannose/fructose/N-acetylgalactosamine-specific phosphotransferase system component IIC